MRRQYMLLNNVNDVSLTVVRDKLQTDKFREIHGNAWQEALPPRFHPQSPRYHPRICDEQDPHQKERKSCNRRQDNGTTDHAVPRESRRDEKVY